MTWLWIYGMADRQRRRRRRRSRYTHRAIEFDLRIHAGEIRWKSRLEIIGILFGTKFGTDEKETNCHHSVKLIIVIEWLLNVTTATVRTDHFNALGNPRPQLLNLQPKLSTERCNHPYRVWVNGKSWSHLARLLEMNWNFLLNRKHIIWLCICYSHRRTLLLFEMCVLCILQWLCTLLWVVEQAFYDVNGGFFYSFCRCVWHVFLFH